ncbi:MupA/Atu3671 family FMN-dependent luciferase-like monooxygenase [Streptomyces sp. SHP 1-2]|uniref:MupA/Atu3671 family FMN-dependent luciferase-like monooxygenase n=1 Tax=Streptomyces sp. SHP 1-2 TaxID=2769489 RepID=UPI0022379ABD|nr:MupA/Atu3671 family FMN-dependent luciferase-like monooxygenase [Streptomyces sp. SHP 1-2]MCW5249583.1 LLM class flavin-dependent oxidoreductase [Streptomyces sp. SHP 1-2]
MTDFSVYFFSSDDRNAAGDRYRFILDVARYLDDRGFLAIWTPERHFQEFGGSFPNPSVLSAALATVTRNLRLRAGSVVLPHHHPVRVAEEWALVDQLSGGRAGICLATGWHKGDFVFHPDLYEDRREYTFGHVATLRALWRGERVSFPGPDGRPLEVRTHPRPHQPELPLWLVHTSNPETWLRAGREGLNVLTLLDSWERLAENVAAYRAARAGAGLDPAEGVVTVGLHTFVGDDEAEVRRTVHDPVRRYLASFVRQKRGDAAVDGASSAMSDEEQRALVDVAAEDFYRRRSLLGTPDKCERVVRRLAGIGVDEIACLVDFGVPFDTVLGMLPRLDALRARCADLRPAPAAAPSAAPSAAPAPGPAPDGPGATGEPAATAGETARRAGVPDGGLSWYYARP